MERKIYYIVATWREGESSIDLLSKEDFEIMRRNMIDDGFDNLQIEWYESGSLALPDRFSVFVYWEAPDIAPEYKEVRKWGLEAAKSYHA